MERQRTQTAARHSHDWQQYDFRSFNQQQQPAVAVDNSDEARLVRQRLDTLLAANAEIEREKAMYRTEREQLEAELMKSPLSTEKALAYFGAMLGLFPPFALFSRFVFENLKHSHGSEDFWIVPLLLFVNFVCMVVGYFSGKLVGRMVAELEKSSWLAMLVLMPFVGILWGVITGAAGGIFIFVIGAFFGAFLAAIVGAAALPAFTVFHRWLKRGDAIEEKHFFPIALGISCIITALILGLKIS